MHTLTDYALSRLGKFKNIRDSFSLCQPLQQCNAAVELLPLSHIA